VDLHRARLLILSDITRTESEVLPLDKVYNRYLAKSVISPFNLPDSNTSLIDGYALNSKDVIDACASNPVTLSVLSENPNSQISNLLPSTALRVTFGSKIPNGANAVIPLKDSFKPSSGAELVVFTDAGDGINILAAGSKIRKGQKLANKGEIINTKIIKTAAEVGLSELSLFKMPKIRIITCGPDLINPTQTLPFGKRYNSLKYEILGYAIECGCTVELSKHCPGRIALESELSNNFDCDAIIIGISQNERYDAAIDAIKKCGELIFSRVQLYPQSAAAFGKINEVPVFVINEDYTLETFEALIRPALLTMQDRPAIDRNMIQAKLAQTLQLDINKTSFIRAYTTREEDETFTTPVYPGSENIEYNSIIIIPPENPSIKRGEIVDVMFIEER
jgi:molybdopterin molybdotransferase